MLSKKPAWKQMVNFINSYPFTYCPHNVHTILWSRVLRKKLIFDWLFMKFFACYRTRSFIAIWTRPRSYSESDVHPVTIYLCEYIRGMDWWMDLLTTYIHHSELQVTTALSIISTLYKSPQHLLNLFPACLFISRSLATASNSGDYSASRAQVLSSQPPVQNSQLTTKCVRVRIRVRVTLRLAVYRQSVRLGNKPLETHNIVILFCHWTLAVTILT
jgi:hypothetical protein